MMLVGAVLGKGAQVESRLYDKDFSHIFRVVKKHKKKEVVDKVSDDKAPDVEKMQGVEKELA